MQEGDRMTGYYVVMCKVYTDTNRESEIPLSGIIHTKRYWAFHEMEHAKENPQYAGEVFYIQTIAVMEDKTNDK